MFHLQMSQSQHQEEAAQDRCWHDMYFNNSEIFDKIKQIKYTDTKNPQYTVRIYVDKNQNSFQYDIQPSQDPVIKIVQYTKSNYLRLGFLAMIAAIQDILQNKNAAKKQVPKPTIRFVFQNKIYKHYIRNAGMLAASSKLNPQSPNNKKKKPCNMDLILRFLLLN